MFYPPEIAGAAVSQSAPADEEPTGHADDVIPKSAVELSVDAGAGAVRGTGWVAGRSHGAAPASGR
jgi:hypothetical protein